MSERRSPTYLYNHRESQFVPVQRGGARTGEDDSSQPVQVPSLPETFVCVRHLTNRPAMSLLVPHLALVRQLAYFAENHYNISSESAQEAYLSSADPN